MFSEIGKTSKATKNRLRWLVKPMTLFEQLSRLLEKKITSGCIAVVWLPLKRCTAVWRNLLYSFSQATAFSAIALSFWFGSRLVADQEYSTQLLEPSKLVMRSLSSLTSRLLKVRPRTLSNCSIRFPRSTRSHQKARF